jgi:hypothetical protein
MIKDDDNMPEWVQSKITLAQDYITSVRDYLQSKEELVSESHKVGDKVTVNSKFFGKQTGKVVKVDGQSVHVQRDGKKSSEKYPHDSVMKEEVLDEKYKIGDKVKIHKGPTDVVGKVGHVGEIRKNTNTYTIDHDEGSVQLKPTHFKKFKEDIDEGLQPDNDPFFDEDADTELSDKDMDDMINNTHEDEFLDAYEDDELHIVDTDTGEPIEMDNPNKEKEKVTEDALVEVLSRSERIRAKMRFAKTKSKRERRMSIVLKTRSNTATLNKRARVMAIKLMKQRIAKKPLSSLSVGEKERLEKIIQNRKALIGRLAMKLTPRMRKIEQDRLSHKKSSGTTTQF